MRNCVTGHGTRLEALNKLDEENLSLKQKMQELGNENATLKGELEKTKKNEVPLEKAQKELTELRNYVTGHGTRLEALNKLDEENLSLKQKMQELGNENATLKGELEKTKKNEVPLEKAQKELTELRNCVTGHGTRLEALNKLDEENLSLKQKMQELGNENATLKGELEKTKKNEVPLEKAQKELTELRNCVTGHGTRLEALNKLDEENLSLKQKMQELGNENATLKGELEKTKKNEVPLEKAQKELTELRNCVTGHGTRLEALNKLDEENLSLKQKIQELGNENATLNSELEKTQKELEESKSCIAGYETKLKEFNKENESPRQEIKNLKNENTTLKGTTKTKTDEVSLEKVEKRQFSPKVPCASLAAMLAVGAALSIASGLSALLIVAASVVSALIAGGITYTISKPIAPDTELKEVDIQGSAQHGVCKT